MMLPKMLTSLPLQMRKYMYMHTYAQLVVLVMLVLSVYYCDYALDSRVQLMSVCC